MKLLVFLLAAVVAFPINPSQYLSSIKGYDAESYFKAEVFEKHTWQTFETLPEVNQPINTENFDLHLMNACLHFVANKTRSSKKVAEFNHSESLRNAALIHSNEMVVKQFYSHINAKNNELRAPDNRMKLFGISNVLMAENIHRFPFLPQQISYLKLAEQVMADFYKSEGHRINLMNKNFTHSGCAALWEYSDKERFHFLKVTHCFAKL